LDCCWQVQRQFPWAFEFNAHYLLVVAEGYQTGWYPTFKGDCECDRNELTGPSLWQLIDLGACRNAAFIVSVPESPPLRPKITMQAIQLWTDLYFKYSPLV
jgi:hypothetical protein